MEEKSYVEDIDRSIYDIRDDEKDAYKLKEGLTPEIVEQISKEKNDPVWMQNFRLQSLQIYNEMEVPNWGPSIEGLDMDHIVTYVRPRENGLRSQRTLKIPLNVLEFHRQRESHWQVLAHSMIPNWFIIM